MGLPFGAADWGPNLCETAMNLQSVLGSARKKFLAPRSIRPARTPRIRVEQLEAREVPATLPTPQIDEFSKRNLGNGFRSNCLGFRFRCDCRIRLTWQDA